MGELAGRDTPRIRVANARYNTRSRFGKQLFADVRLRSKADIAGLIHDVRFGPASTD